MAQTGFKLMYDLKSLRENPEAFDQGLVKRGLAPQSHAILEKDAQRRQVQTTLQDSRNRRNEASKRIGKAKSQGEDAQPLIDEVASLKERMKQLEEEERVLGAALEEQLASLPNAPAEDVPEGADEKDNQEERQIGQLPDFDFEPKEHFDIGEKLRLMDFERAAKLSGARFVVLTGALARLERALAQFMLDLHTNAFGYTEVSPPVLVKDEALFGTGQLPKFSEDLFRTTASHWLIPTAEVPLTNLVAGEILAEEELPLRFTAYTHCFRSEAGSAGRDTRGMLRQHQFGKVELVSITHPEASDQEHERMTHCAETVLQRLELPYRVVKLCTGDMGFSARRTYDLEVWLPGQKMYREISSCSTCGAFQARRMRTRFRPKEGKGNQPVHTLNGSGIAVGRALIAVLENYQQKDGSVTIPEVLRPYMGGLETIQAIGSAHE